jgi:hypothetical protein
VVSTQSTTRYGATIFFFFFFFKQKCFHITRNDYNQLLLCSLNYRIKVALLPKLAVVIDIIVLIEEKQRKEASRRCSFALFRSGSSGGLAGISAGFLGDRLDDTDSDSLAHVTHRETTKRGVVREGLYTHGLRRH